MSDIDNDAAADQLKRAMGHIVKAEVQHDRPDGTDHLALVGDEIQDLINSFEVEQ